VRRLDIPDSAAIRRDDSIFQTARLFGATTRYSGQRGYSARRLDIPDSAAIRRDDSIFQTARLFGATTRYSRQRDTARRVNGAVRRRDATGANGKTTRGYGASPRGDGDEPTLLLDNTPRRDGFAPDGNHSLYRQNPRSAE
jgi:hypothetical protein